MLCEFCKKNEATIHIQEIVNSEKKALHICSECAAKKNQSELLLNSVNLAELLYNISSPGGENPAHQEGAEAGTETPRKCPNCGWDGAQLKQSGRLGCPECYKIYSDLLSTAIKTMHRGTVHIGKQPKSGQVSQPVSNEEEIKRFQKLLEEAISKGRRA